jgi:hypothetical protein
VPSQATAIQRLNARLPAAGSSLSKTRDGVDTGDASGLGLLEQRRVVHVEGSFQRFQGLGGAPAVGDNSMRYGLALLITAAALLAVAWGDYDAARRLVQESLMQK